MQLGGSASFNHHQSAEPLERRSQSDPANELSSQSAKALTTNEKYDPLTSPLAPWNDGKLCCDYR